MYYVIFDATGNCGGVHASFEDAKERADGYMADTICAVVEDEAGNILYYNWGDALRGSSA